MKIWCRINTQTQSLNFSSQFIQPVFKEDFSDIFGLQITTMGCCRSALGGKRKMVWVFLFSLHISNICFSLPLLSLGTLEKERRLSPTLVAAPPGDIPNFIIFSAVNMLFFNFYFSRNLLNSLECYGFSSKLISSCFGLITLRLFLWPL